MGNLDSFPTGQAPGELSETREFDFAMYIALCRVSAYARTLNSAYWNMVTIKDIMEKNKRTSLGGHILGFVTKDPQLEINCNLMERKPQAVKLHNEMDTKFPEALFGFITWMTRR